MLEGNYVQHIHTSHMIAGNERQRSFSGFILKEHGFNIKTEWFKSKSGDITLKSKVLHHTCCLCGQLENRGNA